jgi:hypothetical protein
MVALVEYELVFYSIELDVSTQRRAHQCKSADLGKQDSLGSSRCVTGMVVYIEFKHAYKLYRYTCPLQPLLHDIALMQPSTWQTPISRILHS